MTGDVPNIEQIVAEVVRRLKLLADAPEPSLSRPVAAAAPVASSQSTITQSAATPIEAPGTDARRPRGHDGDPARATQWRATRAGQPASGSDSVGEGRVTQARDSAGGLLRGKLCDDGCRPDGRPLPVLTGSRACCRQSAVTQWSRGATVWRTGVSRAVCRRVGEGGGKRGCRADRSSRSPQSAC